MAFDFRVQNTPLDFPSTSARFEFENCFGLIPERSIENERFILEFFNFKIYDCNGLKCMPLRTKL